MAEITSFSERTKDSLREALLDAAAELLPEKGYTALRMADVAARGGRQPPDRLQRVPQQGLADAGGRVAQHFEDAGDLITAIGLAVRFTIEHAREKKLVAAALSTSEDLLPLLTTKGEPVLSAAVAMAEQQYVEFEPSLAPEAAALLAETVVRLSLSHLVLQTHSAAEAAESVCAVVAPAFIAFTRKGLP